MDRLDPVSRQLAAPTPAPRSTAHLRFGTWAAVGLAAMLALWLGLAHGHNPTDCAAHVLASLPLTLLLVDVWAAGIAVLRRPGSALLTAPTKAAAASMVLHGALWLWARHLVSFDVLYRLQALDELRGAYEARGGIVALLGTLALLSVLAALFEGRLMRWVLADQERTEGDAAGLAGVTTEPDSPAGPEHMYEAQVILNNLGYEVEEIDGTGNKATQAALRRFQSVCGLEPSGELTVLTMIELRNRWASGAEPPPGQSVRALFGHVTRAVAHRAAGWWQGRA